VIVIARRPQQAVHAGGDDRQPPCGAFWFVCHSAENTLPYEGEIWPSVDLLFCSALSGRMWDVGPLICENVETFSIYSSCWLLLSLPRVVFSGVKISEI